VVEARKLELSPGENFLLEWAAASLPPTARSPRHGSNGRMEHNSGAIDRPALNVPANVHAKNCAGGAEPQMQDELSMSNSGSGAAFRRFDEASYRLRRRGDHGGREFLSVSTMTR
jgi:hypothetical protein